MGLRRARLDLAGRRFSDWLNRRGSSGIPHSFPNVDYHLAGAAIPHSDRSGRPLDWAVAVLTFSPGAEMDRDPPLPFAPALAVMETAFRRLESKVPAPVRAPWKDGFVYRYREKTIYQAIVLKLARGVSGLHAIALLRDRGFFQEQAVIQRTLDEIHEDVLFLALAVTVDTLTDLHRRYLDSFYQEEYDDPNDVVGSLTARRQIRRSEIRDYIHKVSEVPVDAERAKAVFRALYRTYSGYVHAGSPQIMDLYNPGTGFIINGANQNPARVREHTRDAWNYFYRGLIATGTAAAAFSDAELVSEMQAAAESFAAGRNLPLSL